VHITVAPEMSVSAPTTWTAWHGPDDTGPTNPAWQDGPIRTGGDDRRAGVRFSFGIETAEAEDDADPALQREGRRRIPGWSALHLEAGA